MASTSAGVSVRQFAKLDGCSHTLVAKAVREGKLPVLAGGLLDPALAGTGWRKTNRNGARVETPGVNPAAVATNVSTSAPVVTPPRSRGQAGMDVPIDAAELGDEDFVAEVLAGRFKLTGDAERVKENALAAKGLLAARREAGDVVDIEVAEAVLFEQARMIRDAWLNWPARVGPLVAAEIGTAADPVVEALTKYVQQQLQDLGEPDPDFIGSEG